MYKSDMMRLIIIYSVVFISLKFIGIIYLLSDRPVEGFEKYFWHPLCLPGSLPAFLKQIWSLLTYFFLEGNFWSLLSNMLWLWIFGSVIEDLTGRFRVIPIFISGGILGGLFQLAYFFWIKPYPAAYYGGAISGVCAVATAALVYKPLYVNYVLGRFRVPLYIFGIIFGLICILIFFATPYYPMIIGAVFAGILSQTVGVRFFDRVQKKMIRGNDYIRNNNNFIKTEISDAGKQYETEDEKLLNILLDKIHEEGMESLSPSERKKLERLSQNKFE